MYVGAKSLAALAKAKSETPSVAEEGLFEATLECCSERAEHELRDMEQHSNHEGYKQRARNALRRARAAHANALRTRNEIFVTEAVSEYIIVDEYCKSAAAKVAPKIDLPFTTVLATSNQKNWDLMLIEEDEEGIKLALEEFAARNNLAERFRELYKTSPFEARKFEMSYRNLLDSWLEQIEKYGSTELKNALLLDVLNSLRVF
jgi:hypothetical protein